MKNPFSHFTKSLKLQLTLLFLFVLIPLSALSAFSLYNQTHTETIAKNLIEHANFIASTVPPELTLQPTLISLTLFQNKQTDLPTTKQQITHHQAEFEKPLSQYQNSLPESEQAKLSKLSPIADQAFSQAKTALSLLTALISLLTLTWTAKSIWKLVGDEPLHVQQILSKLSSFNLSNSPKPSSYPLNSIAFHTANTAQQLHSISSTIQQSSQHVHTASAEIAIGTEQLSLTTQEQVSACDLITLSHDIQTAITLQAQHAADAANASTTLNSHLQTVHQQTLHVQSSAQNSLDATAQTENALKAFDTTLQQNASLIEETASAAQSTASQATELSNLLQKVAL